MAALDPQERSDQRSRDDEARDRTSRRPAPAVGIHQREHQRKRSERDRDRALDVISPLRSRLRSALRNDPRCQRQHRGADRHVHEEHPAPAEHVHDHAAEEQADGSTSARDRSPHRERVIAPRPLGERRQDDRKRGRRQHGPAQPLKTPGHEQRALGLRDPTHERCAREHRDADHEHPRRPSWSASRPSSNKKPPNISVYAFRIHARFACEIPRSRLIVGSETLTMLASRMTMNWATATTASTALGSTREILLAIGGAAPVDIRIESRVEPTTSDKLYVDPRLTAGAPSRAPRECPGGRSPLASPVRLKNDQPSPKGGGYEVRAADLPQAGQPRGARRGRVPTR